MVEDLMGEVEIRSKNEGYRAPTDLNHMDEAP